MNNPFDYMPSAACRAAFGRLTAKIEALRASCDPAAVNFCRELDSGKMLGVMIAAEPGGALRELYAFSGQLGGAGFHFEGFVGPVFDYLQPDGYFRRHEAEISRQNAEIKQFEDNILTPLTAEHAGEAARLAAELAAFRAELAAAKAERQRRRRQGDVTEAEAAEMTRRSQFEKAELRRMKLRQAEHLSPIAARLAEARAQLEAMKARRREDSERLQQWLFTNFRVDNALGESLSLSEIFAPQPGGVPPSGAGECCGPKLLQEAYRLGLRPVEMAEFWYGRPKGGELRVDGEHYGACRGKCRPVLGWMLQGVEVSPTLDGEFALASPLPDPKILFENERFCVVNKPSGMLSVPGKGGGVSVEEWLGQNRTFVKMAHRLDQDTSGLLVAAFDLDTYRTLQRLFATREVRKEYVAVLEGDYEALGIAQRGEIRLRLSADWLDRPRQRVDPENGKEAVTEYEFMESDGVQSRVVFYPHTGRTHQLRVSAASPLGGLGMPIVGDRLYGLRSAECTRLHLHARRIEFALEGQRYLFEAKEGF